MRQRLAHLKSKDSGFAICNESSSVHARRVGLNRVNSLDNMPHITIASLSAKTWRQSIWGAHINLNAQQVFLT